VVLKGALKVQQDRSNWCQWKWKSAPYICCGWLNTVLNV